MFNDKCLIPQFQKVIGGVPDNWIEDALNRGILKKRPDGEVLPKIKFQADCR